MRKTKLALMIMACSAMVWASPVEGIQLHAMDTVSVTEVSTEVTENTVVAKKADEEEHTCGESAKWQFNETSGTLTITGKGKVENAPEWRSLDIKTVKIENGITSIGYRAFDSMKSVQTVVMPESLTLIKEYAFSYCTSLTSITWSNKITNIGSNAFYNCIKLKTVVLPDSVKSVGNAAFSQCKGLSNVTFSKNMDTISGSMFWGCSKLKSVTIPSNIKKICSSAFAFTGLESVTVPSTVVTLQSGVFCNSRNLKSVDFQASIVPSRAFDGCVNLTDITFDDNIREFGWEAFNATGFTSFKVPSSVTELGSYAFSRCNNLKTLMIGKGVKKVPEGIVAYSYNLQDVVIAQGVTNIGNDAFANSYMREIKIPASVNQIGYRAFENAKKLKSIKIPSKVKVIKKETFIDCKALTKITFRKGVTKIGESAFENCSSLKSVTIPGNVKKIDYKAFYNAGLKKLTLNKGVQTVEYWAFQDCDSLKSVWISDSVSKIRDNAFVECDKLDSINVSSGNKTYVSVNGVLYNKAKTRIICCPAGKRGTFQIPASVNKVNAYAFYKCKKLKGFSVAADNGSFTASNGILYNRSQTELISCPSGKSGVIRVPEGVKKIKDYGFQNSSARRITLPSTLQSIGYCAFEYSNSIKKIVIPGNVRKVNSAAFWGCKNLYEVEVESGVNYINSNVFRDCDNLRIVRMPVSVSYISNTAFGSTYNLTFYCKKSSYAMSYASRHYISYKLI